MSKLSKYFLFTEVVTCLMQYGALSFNDSAVVDVHLFAQNNFCSFPSQNPHINNIPGRMSNITSGEEHRESGQAGQISFVLLQSSSL